MATRTDTAKALFGRMYGGEPMDLATRLLQSAIFFAITDEDTENAKFAKVDYSAGADGADYNGSAFLLRNARGECWLLFEPGEQPAARLLQPSPTAELTCFLSNTPKLVIKNAGWSVAYTWKTANALENLSGGDQWVADALTALAAGRKA